MDSMVEENGNTSLDPLGEGNVATSASDGSTPQQTSSATILTTTANIVQFIPTQNIQVSPNTPKNIISFSRKICYQFFKIRIMFLGFF